MVNEGDQAPDFTLQADDGREVSLSDYRGKKVVLYFYPKDDEKGIVKKLYRKVKVKGHAQACLLDLRGSITSEM